MHTITRRLLERLLTHAESEERLGCRKAFNLTSTRAAEYLTQPSFEVKQQIHSELLNLERDGVLGIAWDRRAGDRNLIAGLAAGSAAKLAAALGVVRRKDALATAGELLADVIDHPRVQLALQRWRDGKSVRTLGPEHAATLKQVLQTVTYCRTLERPTAVRRVSAALFGDTKRIEKWGALFDFVTAPTNQTAIDATGRGPAEIFSDIGLIKFAQPLLIAGDHQVRFLDGTMRKLAVPYEGIAPEVFDGLASTPRYVLTIENLTTFHELAALRAGDGGLLLFTAGNFSPAFERSYRHLARDSGCTRFLHWGDVDGKGVEITGRLAELLEESGPNRLEPFRMDADPIEGIHGGAETLDDRTIERMVSICSRHGWSRVADAVQRHRKRVEQESLPLGLPDAI